MLDGLVKHTKVNGPDTGYASSNNEPFPANLLTRP